MVHDGYRESDYRRIPCVNQRTERRNNLDASQAFFGGFYGRFDILMSAAGADQGFLFFVRGSFLQAVLAEAGLATCGEAKAFGLYLMLVRPPGFYFGEVRPKAEPNQNKTLEAEQASDKGQRPEPNHTWQAPPRQAQPAERIPEQKTKSLDQLLQQTSECQSVHKIRQKNPGKCIKIISSFRSLINAGNSPITAMRYPSFTLWY